MVRASRASRVLTAAVVWLALLFVLIMPETAPRALYRRSGRRGSMKELMTMDGETLQKTAADCAEELPGAGLEHPFGPEWEVYKVRGKVFMLMTQVTGEPSVILKSAPDESAALRHEHVEITPGYHMNKRHWITLEGGDTVDETLVKELVTDSYRLVVSGLAKSRQPVDPHTYGRRT